MPIPLLIAGLVALAGGVTLKKGMDAKGKYKEAKEMNARAQRRVQRAQKSMNEARTKAGAAIDALGAYKVQLLDGTVKDFLDTMERIKHVDLTGIKELDIYPQTKEETFRELRNIQLVATSIAQGVGSGVASGVLTAFGAYSAAGALATASTGTAIGSLSGVAATNATLAFFGGGSLAAGGFGVAGGMAVLGGLVTAPMLAVASCVLDSKMNQMLEDAKSNRAMSKAFEEDMKHASVACEAIAEQADMVREFLQQLEGLLQPLVDTMKGIIQQSGTEYRQYDTNEKGCIAQTVMVVKTIKVVLERRLLTEDGSLDQDSVKEIAMVKEHMDDRI